MTRPALFDPAGYAYRSGWAPPPPPYSHHVVGDSDRRWSLRCRTNRHVWPLPPEPFVDILPLCSRCGRVFRWYRVGDHVDGRTPARVNPAHDPSDVYAHLDEVGDYVWYGAAWLSAAGLALGGIPRYARPTTRPDAAPLVGNPRHPRRRPRPASRSTR